MKTKRVLVLLTLLALTFPSFGCDAPGIDTPTPTTTATATPTKTIAPIGTPVTPSPTATLSSMYAVDINKVKENNWALFGTMDVNYVLGVQVDRGIKGYQPFYIVNRYNESVEVKQITTSVLDEYYVVPNDTQIAVKGSDGNPDTTIIIKAKEFRDSTLTELATKYTIAPEELSAKVVNYPIVADIPIKKILHESDLSNVTSITSSSPLDNLTVIQYIPDTNALTVVGFAPDIKRRVTVKYKPDTTYSITFDNSLNEIREWQGSVYATRDGTALVTLEDLLDGNAANVLTIESTVGRDNPVADHYDKNIRTIVLTGLASGVSRTITLTYKTEVANLVKYFKLEKAQIIVAPDSYKPINYSFNIPVGTDVPSRFSVSVYAEATYTSITGIESNIGYYGLIKIAML